MKKDEQSKQEWYWRCEGCGNFLDEWEIINGDGHEIAESFGRRLCGPVNKEKKETQ